MCIINIYLFFSGIFACPVRDHFICVTCYIPMQVFKIKIGFMNMLQTDVKKAIKIPYAFYTMPS